jgi:spermidine/putrescine transport system substrate-binding protein
MARRRFLSALGSAGAAATLAPRALRAASEPAQPIYYTWNGYDAPEFIPDYVSQHGMPITQIFVDEADALSSLREGLVADVVHPCNQSVDHWREAGLIQPIDVARLSNWTDVLAALKSVPGAQADGQQWLVPVDWGTTSVVYRTDLVDIKEESYTLLWDERYAGRLAMGQDSTDTVVIAGVLSGARDPYDMTDAELAAAARLLRQQRPLIHSYWIEYDDLVSAIEAGEIVASSAWPDMYKELRRRGVPVKYMEPKEGILCWCCGAVLTATAGVIDRAYELIDALIAPAAGKWLIEQWGYAHANRKASEIADPQAVADLGLPQGLEGLLSRGIMAQPIRRPELYAQTLNEVIAGAG